MSVTYEELRLSVAQGMAGCPTRSLWREISFSRQRAYLRDADATLSAIRAAGVRLMPAEATEEIIATGRRYADDVGVLGEKGE